MVLTFENNKVLRYSDSLSVPFVRNRAYPVRWDDFALNIIFKNTYLSEGK